MASTNKTTNYELSQYIGSDKPTYLGDYNGDMLKIDNAIHQNALNIATADEKATLAGQNANTALTNASNAQTTADSANSTATNALSKATANETDISNLKDDTGWIDISVGNYNILYRKIGHVVTIKCNSIANITLPASQNVTVATLPVILKPDYNLRFAPFVRGSNNVFGQINTDGTLILFNWSSAITLESGQIAFDTTYLVD